MPVTCMSTAQDCCVHSKHTTPHLARAKYRAPALRALGQSKRRMLPGKLYRRIPAQPPSTLCLRAARSPIARRAGASQRRSILQGKAAFKPREHLTRLTDIAALSASSASTPPAGPSGYLGCLPHQSDPSQSPPPQFASFAAHPRDPHLSREPQVHAASVQRPVWRVVQICMIRAPCGDSPTGCRGVSTSWLRLRAGRAAYLRGM